MTALTIGARVVPSDLGMSALPGIWSVWSRAAEPAGYWLVPANDAARDIPGGPPITYALVKAVMGASAARPRLELIRTDPARPDLERADVDRRNAEKHRSHA